MEMGVKGWEERDLGEKAMEDLVREEEDKEEGVKEVKEGVDLEDLAEDLARAEVESKGPSASCYYSHKDCKLKQNFHIPS